MISQLSYSPVEHSIPQWLFECIDRVARRFCPPVREELLQEAIPHLWLRLGEPLLSLKRSESRSLLCSIVHRLGIDLYRKWQRRPGSLTVAQELCLAAPSLESRPGPAERRLRRIRETLDRLADLPQTSSRIDLHAILLLHLRLSLVATAARQRSLIRQASSFSLTSFVDHCLPWSKEDQNRCCCHGTAPNGIVWARLSPRIDRKPFTVTNPIICKALAGPDLAVQPSRWAKWAQRARLWAQAQMTLEEWEELFRPWLPRNRSRGTA